MQNSPCQMITNGETELTTAWLMCPQRWPIYFTIKNEKSTWNGDQSHPLSNFCQWDRIKNQTKSFSKDGKTSGKWNSFVVFALRGCNLLANNFCRSCEKHRTEKMIKKKWTIKLLEKWQEIIIFVRFFDWFIAMTHNVLFELYNEMKNEQFLEFW